MMELYVDGNMQYIENALGDLSHRANLIMSRAANRTISNVSKNIKKEVSARYRIKSTDIAKTLKVTRASTSHPYAVVESKDVHQNLAYFKVSPLRKGRILKSGKRSPRVYRASVKKGGSFGSLTGNGKQIPFVTTIKKNGFTGVFQRKRGIEGLAGYIEGVYGPAIPQTIKNREVMKAISTEANETMTKRLKHEINQMVYNSMFK